MFERHTQRTEAFEYSRAVVMSVIGCFVLLTCLVIADKIFWKEQATSNQLQYDRHRWNTSG